MSISDLQKELSEKSVCTCDFDYKHLAKDHDLVKKALWESGYQV